MNVNDSKDEADKWEKIRSKGKVHANQLPNGEKVDVGKNSLRPNN